MLAMPFLQAWNGDETVYSWASAHHELRGARSTEETSLLLFGRSRACRQYDFPTGLAYFARWSGERLGDLSELSIRRTQLEEWRPLWSSQQLAGVLRTLPSGRHIRLQVGIAASRLGFRRPLRYCPACCQEQVIACGTTAWRVPHQRMAVLVCTDHRCFLHEVLPNGHRWILPPLSLPRSRHLPLDELSDFTRLADVAHSFARLGNGMSIHDHARALRTALAQAGSARVDLGRALAYMDPGRLNDWFVDTRSGKAARNAFPNVFRMFDTGWIVPLLRGQRSGHPFMWHVLWAAALEHLEASLVGPLVQRFLQPIIPQAQESFSEAATGSRHLFPCVERSWLNLPRQ
ncbi:hypothetical protein HNE04_14820 [Caenimonas sp. S4]|nr:hypothetical protein [Caenimonas soli]